MKRRPTWSDLFLVFAALCFVGAIALYTTANIVSTGDSSGGAYISGSILAIEATVLSFVIGLIGVVFLSAWFVARARASSQQGDDKA